MSGKIWYEQYSELKGQVDALQAKFNERSASLGVSPEEALNEIQRDVIRHYRK